jgi:hypothetical protein
MTLALTFHKARYTNAVQSPVEAENLIASK